MRKSEIRNPKSKIIRPILWVAGAITAAVVLGALLMGVARGVVPTTSDAERFACNGTTTAFVFHFGVWNTSEAEVQKVTNATGAASVLTEASDYTVTLPTTTDGSRREGPSPPRPPTPAPIPSSSPDCPSSSSNPTTPPPNPSISNPSRTISIRPPSATGTSNA